MVALRFNIKEIPPKSIQVVFLCPNLFYKVLGCQR